HVLERAIDVVFVLQAVGRDVELQHADRTQDQVVRHQRTEELRRTFLRQLRQTRAQRLHLQRVAQMRAAEQFRCEVRDAGKGQFLAFAETVADRNGAV